MKWIRLIPDYETTEEYKKAEEEAQRERDEKEAFRVKMTEEIERENVERDRRKKKRKMSSWMVLGKSLKLGF